MKFCCIAFTAFLCGLSIAAPPTPNVTASNRVEDLLLLDNGVVKVGVNRTMGASIAWLSWAAFPHNIVNSADPGRLIQQSYYARLTEITLLGVLAVRLGKKLHWDAKSMRVSNLPEADELIHGRYRAGWELT